MFSKSIAYYDQIYSAKDYRAETDLLVTLIQQHQRTEGKRLLDVACGTGRHLEYLREYYRYKRNIPTVYEACKSNGIEVEELLNLFPDGYRRGACRAAGLPFFP